MGTPSDINSYHFNNVLSQNKYIFAIIVYTLWVVFTLVHYAGQPRSQIIVSAFSLMLGYMFYDMSRKDALGQYNISEYFDTLERGALQQTGLMYKNNVDVAMTPKKLIHVRRREDIMAVVNRMRRFDVFDLGAITSILTLLERFFELYDELMLGNASCWGTYRSLNDLRTEIMNTCSSLEFNVPPEDIADVAMMARQLQAKTARFSKIASRKCEAESIAKGGYAFGHPDGIDVSTMPNEMY